MCLVVCLCMFACVCACMPDGDCMIRLILFVITFACVYFFNSSRLMRHDIEFVSLQVCIDFSSVFGPYIFFLPLHSSRLLYCGLAKLCQVYAYRMPLLNGFLAFLELVCSRRSFLYQYARVQFLRVRVHCIFMSCHTNALASCVTFLLLNLLPKLKVRLHF